MLKDLFVKGMEIMIYDAWITPQNAEIMVSFLRRIASTKLASLSKILADASSDFENNKVGDWQYFLQSMMDDKAKYVSGLYLDIIDAYMKAANDTANQGWNDCVLVSRDLVLKGREIYTSYDDLSFLVGDEVEWTECDCRYRGTIGVIEYGEAIVCDIEVRSGYGDSHMKCVKIRNLHKKYRCP